MRAMVPSNPDWPYFDHNVDVASTLRSHRPTVCLPWTIYFVFLFFYVLIGVLLKGMAESCLLSKD